MDISEVNLNLNSIDLSKQNKLTLDISQLPFSSENIGLSELENLIINLDSGQNLSIKEPLTSAGNLSEALKLLGFSPTPQNIELVTTLLENGFSINKENISKLNQTLKLMDNNMDKALFMFTNEVKPSIKNAEILNNLVSQNFKLTNSIENLVDSVLELPNEFTKNEAITRLLGIDRKPVDVNTLKTIVDTAHTLTSEIVNDLVNLSAKDIIKSDLATIFPRLAEAKILDSPLNIELRENIRQLTPETLNSLIKDIVSSELSSKQNINITKDTAITFLRDVLGSDIETLEDSIKLIDADKKAPIEISKKELIDKLSIKLEKNSPNDIKELLNSVKETTESLRVLFRTSNEKQIPETIKNINDNLNFLNELKNSTYVQFPVLINGNQANAEIFVFNNNKKKSSSSSSVKSALLSLNLKELGHFETYIQKHNNNINCQFSLEKPEIETLIKQNISKLDRLISKTNLSLSNYSFKPYDQPYTIIDSEPFLENKLSNKNQIKSIDYRA